MRAIFMGTPQVAVPALGALCDVAEVVGVVCQPDRPAGRGMKLSAPAVKLEASERGLEVFQPQKVRDGTLSRWMRQKQPDVALVIAYGRILDEETLRAPRLGCVNLHASLLPKYRGAAPIQRALMAGESETGVCLMQMDAGMDTGDVLDCAHLAIDPLDDAGSLTSKLSMVAAQLVREALPRFARGELTPVVQDATLATYAPPIDKSECLIDFRLAATRILDLIRGVSPRPGAYCFTDQTKKKRLKILRAAVSGPALEPAPAPGRVTQKGDQVLVGTGHGALVLVEAQIEGKKPQTGLELLRGRSLSSGQALYGLES